MMFQRAGRRAEAVFRDQLSHGASTLGAIRFRLAFAVVEATSAGFLVTWSPQPFVLREFRPSADAGTGIDVLSAGAVSRKFETEHDFRDCDRSGVLETDRVIRVPDLVRAVDSQLCLNSVADAACRGLRRFPVKSGD